jgi:hypothetical protein
VSPEFVLRSWGKSIGRRHSVESAKPNFCMQPGKIRRVPVAHAVVGMTLQSVVVLTIGGGDGLPVEVGVRLSTTRGTGVVILAEAWRAAHVALGQRI